jgi:hypothetical protein
MNFSVKSNIKNLNKMETPKDNYCHCKYPLFCPICGKEFAPPEINDLSEDELAKMRDKLHSLPLKDESPVLPSEITEKPATLKEVNDLLRKSQTNIYGPGNDDYGRNRPLIPSPQYQAEQAIKFMMEASNYLSDDTITQNAPYTGKSCNEHWIEGAKWYRSQLKSQKATTK